MNLTWKSRNQYNTPSCPNEIFFCRRIEQVRKYERSQQENANPDKLNKIINMATQSLRRHQEGRRRNRPHLQARDQDAVERRRALRPCQCKGIFVTWTYQNDVV
jgi:hypothetical protein